MMSMEDFMESTRESVPLELFRTERELEPGVTLEHIGVTPEAVEAVEAAEAAEAGEGAERVWGNPERDMECWHMQSEENSCAVCCQEYAANQLLEGHVSEAELIEQAKERGWYSPETGTPATDTGKLLESMGLEVEQTWGANLKELADELAEGGKIICGVNNLILAEPEFADFPGLTANHAVEVIGIDATQPGRIQVILNDPGRPDGMGLRVSEDTFQKAWDSGGNFAVTVRRGER